MINDSISVNLPFRTVICSGEIDLTTIVEDLDNDDEMLNIDPQFQVMIWKGVLSSLVSCCYQVA